MKISPDILIYLAAFLFVAGLILVIVKRNVILVLAGIELMLNAANINFVLFSKMHANPSQGQMFALFVMLIAVVEAVVALAILIRVYHYFKTSHLNQINSIK